MEEPNLKLITKKDNGEEDISFKLLSVLFRHNLVYANDEAIVLGFDGFIVLIDKAKDNEKGYICNATIMYMESEHLEKETYHIETIIQLMHWLKCIKTHNKMMFILGSCENVEQIPNAFKREPMYLISRLDNVINED